MTYNTFLDAWFGNGWFSFGIPFLIFILAIILIAIRNKNKPKKKKGFTILTLMYYVVPLAIVGLNGLVNPLYLGYGSPVAVKDVRYSNGKIFVLDYQLTMGSRSSRGSKCFRLNVLDSKTGRKMYRRIVPDGAQIFAIHDDMIAIDYFQGVNYYSTVDGKMVMKLNKQSLTGKYPELSSGIDVMSADRSNELINIQTLDANTWYLNPYTNRLVKQVNQREYVPTQNIYISDDDEISVDDRQGGSNIVELNSYDANNKYSLYNRNDSMMYKDLSFIGGDFVALDTAEKIFVVRHYETVKREKCILTGLKLDGSKKLWEIRQSQLNPSYKIGYKHYITASCDAKLHVMFFNISKEIFAFDIRDGKMMWRQKL